VRGWHRGQSSRTSCSTLRPSPRHYEPHPSIAVACLGHGEICFLELRIVNGLRNASPRTPNHSDTSLRTLLLWQGQRDQDRQQVAAARHHHRRFIATREVVEASCEDGQ
jgi:hypothetical protein